MISALKEIVDLIVAETGALDMKDADEDSVGWDGDGNPLPMTFGHVRRAAAALDSITPSPSSHGLVTDEMVEAACKAFSEGWSVYPDGEAKTQVTDWFDLDAQDAVDFGVLKEPKWDGYSDVRGMQHEWYVAAVVKEPMRAALTAALATATSEKQT